MARYPYQQRSQEQGRSRDYSRDPGRGGRFQGSFDRDRYQAGGERRYVADWGDRPHERDEGFEGERSYAGGGYPEEIGYRREGSRDERDEYGAQQRGYPYQGSGPGEGYGRGTQSFGYNRGDFVGERSRGYGEWSPSWDEGFEGGYYGTGHTGGASGTQAGVRAVGDPYASTGAGIDFYGRRSYPGEERRWRSEGERGGRESDYGRGSGYYGGDRSLGQGRYGGEGYLGSYGAQSRYAGNMREDYGRRTQGYGYGEEYGGSRQPSFRGRGPKGYQRSDERLKEIICERLMEDPNVDASEVSIDVSGSIVTLSGTVDDRRTKYEIEEISELVGGVKDINNQLRVQQRAQSSRGGAQAQSTGEPSPSGRGTDKSGTSATGSSGGSSKRT